MPVVPAAVALSAVSFALLPLGSGPPLPDRLADTGGGSQLIIAVAPRTDATTGALTWWDRRGGRWVMAGSAPARFGAKGLVEGSERRQGTDTTPTGLYDLPYGFGIKAAPRGTSVPYRRVNRNSWWCEDDRSRAYNRWAEPLPADCRAAESEHLADFGTQYARALVIGFNYDEPVRGRGAGIFLHVNGRAATAGCVSATADAVRRILAWAEPRQRPHIAIGTASGPTAISRY
ncbi:L,D-transpeptidase family protein [Streptomyces lunalinharesii]|uniref:L,D-transpeptidase family protein n=1 Tax=Streptomyces lunalinharesii TaxID=333384 RepID=A0ABN3SAB1_9ACTN